MKKRLVVIVQLLLVLVEQIEAEGMRKQEHLEVKVEIRMIDWTIMLMVGEINQMVKVKMNFVVIIVIMVIVSHLGLMMQKDQ